MQSPATRCVCAVPLPRTPCSGDYFEHAQRQVDNAATWRLHSAVGTLWVLLERRGHVVGAPRALCEDALKILYLESLFAIQFDNNTSIHKMYFNLIL